MPRTIKYAAGFALLGAGFYLFLIRGVRFYCSDSESMLPAVNPWDRVVVMGPSGRTLSRGDVVCFNLGENGRSRRLKRVMGLPGDEVEIKDRKLYINGEPAEEPYLYEQRIVYRFGPEKVPEGRLFVLGDNRNSSSDSAEWGFLPAEDVIGRALMVCWPYIRLF